MRLGGIAALALALLTLAGSAFAARRGADSTTTHGARVTVGPTGVVIDGGGSDGARIDVGGTHGIRVSVDSGDSNDSRRRVRILGPHMTVDSDGELVRVFSDAEVREGERVDGDVVTIFGSSRIDGHVVGNAIAVFGSVRLGASAAVDGDMVAIFGTVHRAEGATVGGEIVDLGVSPPIPGLSALPTILLCVGLFWLLSLIGGWIVTLIMPERLMRITATASQRMGGSLVLGLVSLPLLIATVVLLCITVIGIPVAIVLPLVFGVISWIGQYAGLYGLGLKLMRRRIGQGGVFGPLVVGTLFVAAFFAASALFAGPPGITRTLALFLVCVGGLICFALQLIGVGAVFLSRYGTLPKDLPLVEAPLPAQTPQPAAPPVGA